jgi:hypothetical protein
VSDLVFGAKYLDPETSYMESVSSLILIMTIMDNSSIFRCGIRQIMNNCSISVFGIWQSGFGSCRVSGMALDEITHPREVQIIFTAAIHPFMAFCKDSQ